jgi:hypothetical protein
MVALTIFIVNGGSTFFLTNFPLPEATTIEHARREEQRASGLAKVVKSNLGKSLLARHCGDRVATP